MLSRREMLLSSMGAALSAPTFSTGTWAQENWPTREIHSICMFPPGSGADILVRFYAKKFQEAIGKTVIVENKVGSFGNIANEYVARSKPDGYTIYIAPANLLAIAPHIYTKLNYDPINDFDHITTLFKIPFLLTVAADSPYKTVADLVADMKLRGDKASYGSVSTVSLVSAELFKAQFGLATVEVKYKESQAAVMDMLGGNLSFVYIDPAGSAAQIKAGKLRALAVTTKNRLDALPDIPGSGETGIANTDLYSWWTVHTPKGTPKPILSQLEAVFNKIAVEPDTKAFLANAGCDPFPGNSKLANELIVSGVKQWGEYVKLAKIEPLS
ncbi:MAG: Bug family tripartite tricarboxylate transporter substrate binding protein [Xanthobacteraceae bacterium]